MGLSSAISAGGEGGFSMILAGAMFAVLNVGRSCTVELFVGGERLVMKVSELGNTLFLISRVLP